MGRLVPRKGVDLVIRALPLLREAGFDDVELLIVGGGGGAAALDADPEVRRLLGPGQGTGRGGPGDPAGAGAARSDMPGILRSADAVVCTPWYEPFGIVPLEAMACGVPVVAAAVGGLTDTVVDRDRPACAAPGSGRHRRGPGRTAGQSGAPLANWAGRPASRVARATRGTGWPPKRRRPTGWRWRTVPRPGGWSQWKEQRCDCRMAAPRAGPPPTAAPAALPGAAGPRTGPVPGGSTSRIPSALSRRTWTTCCRRWNRCAARRTGWPPGVWSWRAGCCAGQRLLAAGNGGSAAEAQHLTAELVGRFDGERVPFSAISLHAETSAVTAIANDYGFEELFARQVRAHGRSGDVLMLLSTSGKSPNLLRAAEAAARLNITTWALTGPAPNPLAAPATRP